MGSSMATDGEPKAQVADAPPEPDPPYDLDAALAAAGWRPKALEVCLGATRTTIWRWRTGQLPVPQYLRFALAHRAYSRKLEEIIARLEGAQR